MLRKELLCQVCGNKFYASRSDAKYCSNKCRQKEHRENTKHVQTSTIVTNLSPLREYIDYRLESFFTRYWFNLEKRDYYGRYWFNYNDKLSSPDTDMFYLTDELGIVPGIYKEDYVDIDTPEKSEQLRNDLLRLKNAIMDKWHNGTDKEKKRIFIYYFKHGVYEQDLLDIYAYIFTH